MKSRKDPTPLNPEDKNPESNQQLFNLGKEKCLSSSISKPSQVSLKSKKLLDYSQKQVGKKNVSEIKANCEIVNKRFLSQPSRSVIVAQHESTLLRFVMILAQDDQFTSDD